MRLNQTDGWEGFPMRQFRVRFDSPAPLLSPRVQRRRRRARDAPPAPSVLALFTVADVELAECGWGSVNDFDLSFWLLFLQELGELGYWPSSWWCHIAAALAAEAAIETGWETTRVDALCVRFDG